MSSQDDAVIMMMNPRIRKSPFFDQARRHGARVFSVYNHMFIPQGYRDPGSEFRSLINDVTLWDVGVEQPVEITGPDAFDFTNLLTPRDLTQCEVGQGKYAIITTQEGGIVNDPVLSRLDSNHFWLAPSDSDLILWAKGVAVNSGSQVDIKRADSWPVQIQGAKSKEVMAALFGDEILKLSYYHIEQTNLNGIPVVVARTGWTGELGYEIYLRDAERGGELWEAIMKAGRPHNIVTTGPSHIRRIEAGILNYGIDMTLETNPFELGLGWQIDLDQEADFIGKEALRRIKAEGVTRKLVGVELHGDPIAPNEHPWPVRSNGKRIGQMTSSVYSPRLKKNIGYAMLPIQHADLGTALEVETVAGERGAEVVKKPFVDPKKEVPKG